MSTKEVFDLFNRIKQEIIGDRQRPRADQTRLQAVGAPGVRNLDAIPEFKTGSAAENQIGVSAISSALAGGSGAKSAREILAIVLVAIVIIGGMQALLTASQGSPIRLS